jgi:iron-sulfur cluster assembly accessory protein
VAPSAVNLTVTAAAERFARRMIRMSGLGGGAGLQLRVAPGGCSGYSTTFDVAAAPAPAETVIAVESSLQFFVDAPSAALLAGATLDFVESATEAGLKVTSPDAACGCGTGTAAPAGATRVPITSIGRMKRT